MINRVSVFRAQSSKPTFRAGFRVDMTNASKPTLQRLSQNDEIAKLFQATKEITSGKLSFRDSVVMNMPEEFTSCTKKLFATDDENKVVVTNVGIQKACACIDIVEDGVQHKFFREPEDKHATAAYDALKKTSVEFSE